jgi:hypothetical protein
MDGTLQVLCARSSSNCACTRNAPIHPTVQAVPQPPALKRRRTCEHLQHRCTASQQLPNPIALPDSRLAPCITPCAGMAPHPTRTGVCTYASS